MYIYNYVKNYVIYIFQMCIEYMYNKPIGAKYATGDQWRNNFRKNEGIETKQKQHPFVDVTGGGSKV